MRSIYILRQLKVIYGFAHVQEIDSEFTSWFPEQPACLLTSIFVRREMRGRHYGSQLLDRILFDADQEHATVYLQVAPDDDSPLDAQATQDFYARHGFTEHHTDRAHLYLMIRRPHEKDQCDNRCQRHADSVECVHP